MVRLPGERRVFPSRHFAPYSGPVRAV